MSLPNTNGAFIHNGINCSPMLVPTAQSVPYNNSNSGLSATNVQGAIDEVVSEKADKATPPPDYDATSTYNAGDVVTYNNTIYQCNTYIQIAEAWTPSHWTLVTPDTDYLHSINPVGYGSFSLNRKPNTTIGLCSFAEGYNCTASSNNGSHAEGYCTTASGSSAHAEGRETIASNLQSHAEGLETVSSGGNGSHSEGRHTTASGISSHAEGSNTTASGNFSHSEGYYTTANHKSQHTFGEYNILDSSSALSNARGNYVEIVGNGTADDARSNARTLDWDGNEVLAGGLKINGTQDVATTSSLSTVATSGSYNDLTNKPDLTTNYVRVGMGNAPLNLNDCVNGCVYWCNNTGGGTTYTNAPGASAYHIYTFKPISTHGFQMAVQFSGNQIYVRTIADNTWGAWKSVTLS